MYRCVCIETENLGCMPIYDAVHTHGYTLHLDIGRSRQLTRSLLPLLRLGSPQIPSLGITSPRSHLRPGPCR
jgi:hypothetical protein